MDRPGLVELLAYARKGDTLAVVRLDRLGRSLAELLATVTMLKERGIALLSLEEKIDTSSVYPQYRFLGAAGLWVGRPPEYRVRIPPTSIETGISSHRSTSVDQTQMRHLAVCMRLTRSASPAGKAILQSYRPGKMQPCLLQRSLSDRRRQPKFQLAGRRPGVRPS
jgi:hypothetical protein